MADKQSSSSVKERSNTGVDEPKKYQVIFHNDDFTTWDVVVSILMKVFRKSESEADRLTEMVDRKKKAIVGVYPYDIAASRTKQGIAMARNAGAPLKITFEEAK